jgi:hypothetical protein
MNDVRSHFQAARAGFEKVLFAIGRLQQQQTLVWLWASTTLAALVKQLIFTFVIFT